MDSARPRKMPGWIVRALENFSVSKRVCRKQTTGIVIRGFCLFSFSNFSGAPAARRAVKRNPITIGTGSHACIEIETHATLFSW